MTYLDKSPKRTVTTKQSINDVVVIATSQDEASTTLVTSTNATKSDLTQSESNEMETESQSDKDNSINDSDDFTTDDLDRLLALIEETDPFDEKLDPSSNIMLSDLLQLGREKIIIPAKASKSFWHACKFLALEQYQKLQSQHIDVYSHSSRHR